MLLTASCSDPDLALLWVQLQGPALLEELAMLEDWMLGIEPAHVWGLCLWTPFALQAPRVTRGLKMLHYGVKGG